MPKGNVDPFVEAERLLREHGAEQGWRESRIERSITTLRLFFTGQADGEPYQFGGARQAIEDFFVSHCEHNQLSGLPGQREVWYEASAQHQVSRRPYRVTDRRRRSFGGLLGRS